MSERIKEARQTAGLTQKRMSELLLIPLRTIENWESGKRNPPLWAENLIVEKLKMMRREK
nr:MAG TPA: helix-turn-helix domain protein [Bacteriophage sp.]